MKTKRMALVGKVMNIVLIIVTIILLAVDTIARASNVENVWTETIVIICYSAYAIACFLVSCYMLLFYRDKLDGIGMFFVSSICALAVVAFSKYVGIAIIATSSMAVIRLSRSALRYGYDDIKLEFDDEDGDIDNEDSENDDNSNERDLDDPDERGINFAMQ